MDADRAINGNNIDSRDGCHEGFLRLPKAVSLVSGLRITGPWACSKRI